MSTNTSPQENTTNSQPQSLPGSQQEQSPTPEVLPRDYPNGKLAGKVAVITGPNLFLPHANTR